LLNNLAGRPTNNDVQSIYLNLFELESGIKMTATPKDNPKVRQIFKAVRTVLAAHGYAGTTISRVAGQAGISRGLLHYYFKNKEDMLAQAIESTVETSLGAVATTFAGSKSPEDVARGLCTSLRKIIQSDPHFISLILEGWAASRRIPAVSRQIHANFRRIQRAVTKQLEDAKLRGIISPDHPLGELSRLFIALFDGLGMQLVFEPELLNSRKLWSATEAAVCMLLRGSGKSA
jgi:AcrR family transcriptional regulator